MGNITPPSRGRVFFEMRCYGQTIVNCTLLLYEENTSASRGKFDLPWLGEVTNPFVDRLSTCCS